MIINLLLVHWDKFCRFWLNKKMDIRDSLPIISSLWIHDKSLTPCLHAVTAAQGQPRILLILVLESPLNPMAPHAILTFLLTENTGQFCFQTAFLWNPLALACTHFYPLLKHPEPCCPSSPRGQRTHFRELFLVLSEPLGTLWTTWIVRYLWTSPVWELSKRAVELVCNPEPAKSCSDPTLSKTRNLCKLPKL